jgi:uncharacterized protein (TIGR03437 family)
MFAAMAAMAALGCSDTAYAQPQLIVTPATATNPNTPLVFNNIPSGGVSPIQPLSVTTGNSTMATVIIQINANSPWLVVTPSGSVNIPSTLNVQCNTTALVSGNYNGSFTISVAGSGSGNPAFVTVYVSLNVTGTSQLSATPPSLAFSAQAGATSATPSGIQVQILSTGAALNYSLQAQTNNGGMWLLVSATQGSSGGPQFTVSVNPSGLSATTYPAIFNGVITATSTSTSDSVQIPVQLTLTASAMLSVSPTNPPPFLYQAGAAADPPAQQLQITSGGGSLAFSIQESPAVSWLSLSALGGTAGSTASTITLTATPKEQGLQAGTYTTSLIVTPSGEPALPPVPISLVVAAHPLIQLSANSLAFTSSFAGSSPPAQSVIVNSSGGAAVGFTITSNASWLTATPSSGTSPTTVTVQVNTASLAVQNYTGTLTISPTNGDPYTETIAVSLSVSSASQLIAGPAGLLFSYETTQLPPSPQTIQIQTTGQQLTFSVTPTTVNCGSNWLGATTSSPFVVATSNTILTVSVSTAGLTAGTTCSGTVTLNYDSGVGPATLAIPVTLAVSGSAELRVSTMPGFGIPPAVTQVSAPFQQQISLTSTDPAAQVSYTAAVINMTGGGTWLGIVGSTSGTTPQNLILQYSPSAVTTPGTYTAMLEISSPTFGAGTFSIPVMMTVTSTTSVTINPGSLTFTEAQGGGLPAAQTLMLSSNPGTATYTAAIAYLQGSNWLQISPTSGNASGSLQVSVLANSLSQGSYTAQISFAFQGAATTSALITVVLNVTGAQTVTAAPTALNFAYQGGGATPAAQQLSVTNPGGPVAIAVSASSSGWLSVSPSSGSTPLTVNVSVNPAGLAAQTYSGSVSISAPGVLATPLSIPVSFVVTAAPQPQPVVIFNNATGGAGVIAPGEELAIKGSSLGPSTPTAGTFFSVNSSGGVSNTLAGVQVTFDNIPGTPIFVSATEIDVMVPYEINGRLSTTMVVLVNGVASLPFQLGVVPAAPGLFTNNLSGTGQVAALNQDNSFNGAGTGFAAAPRGTVISLFGTGGGQSNPISTTGSVTPIPTSPSGYLLLPNVTAAVGGLPATVLFAGEAPGEVTGVFQVNILIPAGVTPGNAVPVTVAVGSASSPLGTTIAVK